MGVLRVGIDIAHKEHVVCLADGEGHRLGKPFSVANNRPGAQELAQRITEAAKCYERVDIGMEATGIYWWHLYRYLAEEAEGALPEQRFVLFNPKLIHAFRKVCNLADKTDKRDAYLITERLRFDGLPNYPPPDPRYFPLARLTRYRYHLTQTMVRTKAHALMLLFLADSDYERCEPFRDTFGSTSLAVLEEYKSPKELAQAPVEELAGLLDEKSRHRLDDTSGLAERLKEIAAESFRLDEEAAEAVGFSLESSIRHVRFLSEELKVLDRRIAREMERFPNTLSSVPGIGPVFCAGLVAEIGDVRRFDGEETLARYAGLWWPRNQSGDFEATDRTLSKEGNVYLRYYLCEAANSLRVHNEEYRRYYEAKYKETPKHPHKRACVLTARKLVRLVYALLKTNQPYHGSKASGTT